MAAVTSVMRVQQLLLSRVEDTLKPYGLTFAAYEALRLLAFSRRGSLPMGKMGERLMVHPASVTNAITRLEHRGLVERRLSPDDRRVVLATITPDGQALVREATEALNQASFSLPGLSPTRPQRSRPSCAAFGSRPGTPSPGPGCRRQSPATLSQPTRPVIRTGTGLSWPVPPSSRSAATGSPAGLTRARAE